MDKVNLDPKGLSTIYAVANCETFYATIGVRGTRVWVKKAFYINNIPSEEMSTYFDDLNKKDDLEREFYGDQYVLRGHSLDVIIEDIKNKSSTTLESFCALNDHDFEVYDSILETITSYKELDEYDETQYYVDSFHDLLDFECKKYDEDFREIRDSVPSKEHYIVINSFDDNECCAILPKYAYDLLLSELKEVNEYCKENDVLFWWI